MQENGVPATRIIKTHLKKSMICYDEVSPGTNEQAATKRLIKARMPGGGRE